MKLIIFLILTFNFYLLAQAQITVKMMTPGSIPQSNLYLLLGTEAETSEEVAQYLSQRLNQNISSIESLVLQETDIKTALKETPLPINQLNKIEYFSNKNQSKIFKIKIKNHQYQIYVSASKDLALIVES